MHSSALACLVVSEGTNPGAGVGCECARRSRVTPSSADFGSRRSLAGGRAGLHPDTAPRRTSRVAAEPYVVTSPRSLQSDPASDVAERPVVVPAPRGAIAAARSVTRRCLICVLYAPILRLFRGGLLRAGGSGTCGQRGALAGQSGHEQINLITPTAVTHSRRCRAYCSPIPANEHALR